MTDAELAAHKAREMCLIIRSGLLDAQLHDLLNAVTDRMSSPEYRRVTYPRPGREPESIDPSDPDSWPTSGLFAPRDG